MMEYQIFSSIETNFFLKKHGILDNYNKYLLLDDYEKNIMIFLMPNKEVLVLAKGNNSVLFSNQQEMEIVLKEQGVPIPFDGYNPFENNLKRISNLDKENVQSFLDELCSLLNVNVEINGEEKYLLSLSKPINSYLRKTDKMEAYLKLYVPLGIYVGEVIISLVDGYWHLDKEYGINPYWTPNIKNKDHEKLHLWKPILDSFSSRRINIPFCIDRANITTPKLFSKCNLD